MAWLRRQPLTTLQARQQLDVMHPAARVQELKAKGHNIVTNWAEDYSGKGKHRVASYILLSAGQ
ncbi:MAG: helix-turn-helix domain-containing protein [Methylobacter sp.]